MRGLPTPCTQIGSAYSAMNGVVTCPKVSISCSPYTLKYTAYEHHIVEVIQHVLRPPPLSGGLFLLSPSASGGVTSQAALCGVCCTSPPAFWTK